MPLPLNFDKSKTRVCLLSVGVRVQTLSVSPVDKQRHQNERDADAADVVLVVGDHLGIGIVGVLRDGGGVEQDVGDVEQRGRCPGRELDAMRTCVILCEVNREFVISL